jgi:hypothetical protein
MSDPLVPSQCHGLSESGESDSESDISLSEPEDNIVQPYAYEPEFTEAELRAMDEHHDLQPDTQNRMANKNWYVVILII